MATAPKFRIDVDIHNLLMRSAPGPVPVPPPKGLTLPNRALTFTTFIIANLALILANRSWTRLIVATLRSPNPALWWVIGGALAMLAVVLYVPFVRDLFRFSRLHNVDLVICSIAGVFSVLWFEALKIFGRSRVASGA